ncbi:MAG: DUF362 domain-containing protein [Dehalococcoidales bacterium]|nr:MAG: DUF362 domain-containing protein [Dehalococcoidales bacterium]
MSISRRNFITNLLKIGAGAIATSTLGLLAACTGRNDRDIELENPEPVEQTRSLPLPSPKDKPYISVVHGEDPNLSVKAAIDSLGGIDRFVKKGNDVIIKPNICNTNHGYEYAATTNPDVVAAIVTLCLDAGAERVRVMDQPFGGTGERGYEISGIGDAVKAVGGEIEVMSPMKFRKFEIPDGIDIKNWPVYTDCLETDVLINVPIAKHHALARLTLGMKNLMGIIGNRTQFHFNLGQRIADLTSLVHPQLTVIDAIRILKNHGPTGGDLADVEQKNMIIASHDMVAADSFATRMFGLTPGDIPALRCAETMCLGVTDLTTVEVEEISV